MSYQAAMISLNDLVSKFKDLQKQDYWKGQLSLIYNKLRNDLKHPDAENFRIVSHSLFMNDHPGYWHWLNTTLKKLKEDETNRFDPIPEYPSYENMSIEELLNKLEFEPDIIYSKNDLLYELKDRYEGPKEELDFQKMSVNEVKSLFARV